jgi:hypothetical protein
MLIGAASDIRSLSPMCVVGIYAEKVTKNLKLTVD